MINAATKGITGLRRLSFPKLRKREKPTFSRRHSRHACVLIGTMKVVEIGAEFDGALVEVSWLSKSRTRRVKV